MATFEDYASAAGFLATELLTALDVAEAYARMAAHLSHQLLDQNLATDADAIRRVLATAEVDQRALAEKARLLREMLRHGTLRGAAEPRARGLPN